MEVSFICRKFNAMLGVATVTMSVNYIVMLSGSVIVGNLVGADGLSAVSACTPVFGIARFVASLLSVGTGLVFSQAMGAFDDRRAGGVFTQSFVLAAIVGAALALAMAVGRDVFLDFTGVTGSVRAQAVAYWEWQTVAMALTPMVLLMEALVYADGDCAVAAAAGVCHVAGSIGLSVLFTRLAGTAGGASAGTALTMLLVIAVASLHFLRRNNHLKFVCHWSARDFGATCAGSLPDASIYLCWGLLIMLVNKVTVVRFGEGLLPVVALAASVVEFSIVFDGVGEALIPLGGMYMGEGNSAALRRLANHSALMATLEGVVCGLAFAVFAPVIAPLYGIRGSAAPLLPDAVAMIRILACAMPFMGFLMMANTHFLVVRQASFAVSVTYMKDLVLPGLMIFPCMHVWGFDGLWIGFALGYALAAAYPFLFVLVRHGPSRFPWLVAPDRGLILDFAVRLTPDSVRAARDRIAAYLAEHGVIDQVANRVTQVVEETGILSAAQQKGAVASYTVFLDRPGLVRVVTRDTGRPFDGTALTPHLSALAERRYLNTLNCNRSEYLFRVQERLPASGCAAPAVPRLAVD